MDYKSSTVYLALYHLYELTQEILYRHIQQAKVDRINYQNFKVLEVDYEGESYNLDWEHPEYFEHIEWPTNAYLSLIDNIITNSNQIDQVVNAFVNEFNPPHEAIEVIKPIVIRAYVDHLINNIPNGRINDNSIGAYINRFLNDYRSELSALPIVWQIEVWITNLKLESEVIEISKGVVLRRPEKKDLNLTEQRGTYRNEIYKIGSSVLPALAILCISVQAKKEVGSYPKKASDAIEYWLNLLRLFKPGSFTSVYQTVSPVSVFYFGISENIEVLADKIWRGKIEQYHTSNPNFFIKKSEEDTLKKFAEIMLPTITAVSSKNYLSGNSIDLAIHRYLDVLLRSEVNAYKIQSAMTALEALLSNDTSEITYKIRLRVAGILRIFDFDTISVFQKIKDAYNLRSKIVHGSNTKDKKNDLLEFARQHTQEIVNYTRICLLVCLQVRHKRGKDDLIALIDHSFINDQKFEELVSLIKENCTVPSIDPFV